MRPIHEVLGFLWNSRNTGASGFRYRAPFVLTGVALLLGIPFTLQSGES